MSGHPVEDFWAALNVFEDYPPDVTPVPEMLPGTAAFAASAGLCRPAGSRDLPPFPYGGLMVVGHNLDNRNGYESRRRSGESHGDQRTTGMMSTWRGLYRLLESAGIETNEFFFTNVFVGLKEGRPTGRFSAYEAPEYRKWCRTFLEYQVTTMQPRVVLVLGVPACRDIADVATPRPWPIGPLPPPAVVRAQLFDTTTLLVPAHHTSIQTRIERDADALRRAWNESDRTH